MCDDSSEVTYRALVVDNDPAIKQFTVAALTAHGIDCATASNGYEALTKIAGPNDAANESTFDVVIVDLRVLNDNGQPVALDLVKLAARPLVVVQTIVIEPQLAHELIARGVDDVLIKPLDCETLANKVCSLLERRRDRRTVRILAGARAAQTASVRDFSPDERVTSTTLKQKLNQVSQVLPISAAALDVYEMTSNLDWDLSQIAAAVQRDASLTTAVLRLANSAYYNPPGRPIVELDEAVMRIGQKRVGEMALSINALSTVTPAKLPWMDLDLSWNRSMAAGIALELLVDMGGHEEVADGLFVSAIMHPLGRIVLGMLFPAEYESLLGECSRTGGSLRELERQMFPATHTDVMAQLLDDWRLAPEVFIPLKFSLDDYPTIARLLEPMRTRAELVKVAIVLGRLAVGRWEDWDLVQFPPANVLERLRVHSIEQLVQQVRGDVARLAEFHPNGTTRLKKPTNNIPRPEVAYCNFSHELEDLVKAFLPGLGLEVQDDSAGNFAQLRELVVANCLGVEPNEIVPKTVSHHAVLLVDRAKSDGFAPIAPAVTLPNSVRRLREAIMAGVAACADESLSIPV